MDRYPCKNCEERHIACWGKCERYQAAKERNTNKPIDEFKDYIASKGKMYKTKYGWRR